MCATSHIHFILPEFITLVTFGENKKTNLKQYCHAIHWTCVTFPIRGEADFTPVIQFTQHTGHTGEMRNINKTLVRRSHRKGPTTWKTYT
jgi:hypothetical protein